MHQLVLLAKSTVEKLIKEGEVILPPSDLPEEFLSQKAGTFVTIEKSGNLRGCIGTYLPIKENIAKEIIANAIAAATEDCRFEPIQKEELPDLTYTVYILGKPELIRDIKELNPKKYGIIIKTMPIVYPNGTDVVFDGHLPYKTGLLLPDLDGVDTIEKQIAIACQKSDIDLSREQIIIYRFMAEKHQEIKI